MIRSYSHVLYELEKEKFKNKIEKVNNKREEERMKTLESMKKRSKGKINPFKTTRNLDRHERLKELVKKSIYNINIDKKKLLNFSSKNMKKSNSERKFKKTNDQHYLLSRYLAQKNRRNGKEVKERESHSKSNFSKLCEEIERWDIHQAMLTTSRLKRKLKDDLRVGNWGDNSLIWGDYGVRNMVKSERGVGGGKGEGGILLELINRRLRDNIIRD